MRNDKHLAVKLRKQRKSYNAISRRLDIPKSTLACWLKNERWSQQIKRNLTRQAQVKAKKQIRLLAERNKQKWERWREKYRMEARQEFRFFVKNPLFVAGINLYWGEGDLLLKNGIIRLANIDPRMIILFTKFLKEILKVPTEKIRLALTLYPDLVNERCIRFWSKAIKIPKNQFYKTQYIKGRHPTKRLEFGICTIQIHSRGLKEKIIIWIDLFYKEFLARV